MDSISVIAARGAWRRIEDGRGLQRRGHVVSRSRKVYARARIQWLGTKSGGRFVLKAELVAGTLRTYALGVDGLKAQLDCFSLAVST